MSLIQSPTKYAYLTGNADLAYDAICKTLSERAAQVDWDAFDQNDWQLFAQIADTEGVAPLLHWQVKTGAIMDEWPSEVRQFMQARYYRTTAQNTLLFQELERILAAFESAQIPVIVLKGAALAQTIYSEPGLRPMGDLDLLIQQDNLAEALMVMQNLSYLPVNAEQNPGMRELMTYDIALRSSQHDHFPIELHWQLIANRGDWREPDLTWFWDNRQTYSISTAGKAAQMRYLDPVAHLLFLAAHLKYKHDACQTRLLWLYDIDQIIRNKLEPQHYDQLATQAETFIWTPALVAAISQVNHLFDTPLPLDWLDQLKQKEQDPLAVQLLNQRAERPTTRSIEMWSRIKAQKGLKKIALILRFIFPTPNYIRQRYQVKPGWLWPLYYPYRWLDMSVDIFKTNWRRLQLRSTSKK
jgi:hypothetical protein